MQQAAESVFAGHLFHERHDEHVVVDGQVALLVNRSQLKLVRSHLVVAGLARDTQLQRLNLQIRHEGSHASRDRAEIVVIHLLVLGRVVSQKCTAGHEQVGAGGIQAFIHQEVLLFPTQVYDDLLHFRIKIVAHIRCRLAYRMDGLFQRCLIIQRLTGVRDENGRNHQCVTDDEHRRCVIPCRVAASFESGTDTTVRERRRVGFLLYELLSGEFLDHSSLAVVLHKSVMLFGGTFGQRLEPVCAMGYSQFHGPFLHTFGHLIGCFQIQRRTVVHYVAHFLICLCRQIFVHFLTCKDILRKKFRRTLFGFVKRHGLFLKSLTDYFKS